MREIIELLYTIAISPNFYFTMKIHNVIYNNAKIIYIIKLFIFLPLACLMF